MGGKEFKKEKKRDEERSLPYSVRLQNFEKESNILQSKIITARFFQENKIIDNFNPTNNELSQIIHNNREKAKQEGISNPNLVFTSYLCQRFVDSYVLIKNYNLFKTIDEIIDKLQLAKEDIENLNLMKERFEKEFPTDLKLVKYNLNSKEFKNLEDLQFLGINSNLLFNKSLQPEVLTLILDDNLLDNIDLSRNIADIISNCQNLFVVNFILYPINRDGKLAEEFGLDGQNYQSLYALIKAVTVNRNIKSFFFHSVEYYNLNLAPEICRLIEQKLQSETLVAFHFGNFNLNENWIKKIEFLLGSTKSLLFLSYENKKYTKEDVLDFKRVVSKNRSIMILSVVTPIFKGMKIEVVDKIKQALLSDNKDSKLNLVYLSNQSLIDPAWFSNPSN
jgi:hypothetical protein